MTFPQRFIPPISIRILLFNLLLIFLPIAGFLYFNIYENQLLKMLEHAMVQQGRIMASALSGRELEKERAELILKELRQRQEARIRVLSKEGILLADSSTILQAPEKEQPEKKMTFLSLSDRWDPYEDYSSTEENQPITDTFLYRLASFPVRLVRKHLLPPTPPLESAEFFQTNSYLQGSEVQAALEGRYGAVTRISPEGQVSVTLYSAIPITGPAPSDAVTGVVLVSQSTYRILNDLYELRMRVFVLFLWCFIAALIISLVVFITVSVPVKILQRRAHKAIDQSGRLVGPIEPFPGNDEIANLSRSLSTLTGKLKERADFIESFSSDVAHEIKNPLAAIRSAAETGLSAKTNEHKDRFLSMIHKDVQRITRIISELRELSRLDGGYGSATLSPADLSLFLKHAIPAFQELCQPQSIKLELTVPDTEVPVMVEQSQLYMALENLVRNGVSFSPPDSSIFVSLKKEKNSAVLQVRDSGPGIEPGHEEIIFKRFFSYRPVEDSPETESSHSGLGLAIVKTIIENHGGTISAHNSPIGALFTITLPLLTGHSRKSLLRT